MLEAMKQFKSRAVVVVKVSACLPSALTIRVRIPLTSTVVSVKFVNETNENKEKEGGDGQFKNSFRAYFCLRVISVFCLKESGR